MSDVNIPTKDLQSQVQSIHPAFHMQFRIGLKHRSQSFGVISPNQNKGMVIMMQQHQALIRLIPIGRTPNFTLKSKLLILFVQASTVKLSRFVPTCTSRNKIKKNFMNFKSILI